MQAPNIPSLFRTKKIKKFHYQPRYYSENKKRLKGIDKYRKETRKLFSNKRKTKYQTKNILLIIITSIFVILFVVFIKNILLGHN